jgi:hypothetical protein
MNGRAGDKLSQDLDAVLQRARSERALFLRTSLSSRMNQTRRRSRASVLVRAVTVFEWLRGRLAALHAVL